MAIEKIDSLTDPQIEDLHALYQSEWWSQGRSLSDIRCMLQHCDVIAAFCDSETRRLIAFARVITDYVYKALVFDVIVAVSHRGQGVGRALMEAIVTHPSLESVQHVELYCLPEMTPFYKQWEFTDDVGELRFMRRMRQA